MKSDCPQKDTQLQPRRVAFGTVFGFRLDHVLGHKAEVLFRRIEHRRTRRDHLLFAVVHVVAVDLVIRHADQEIPRHAELKIRLDGVGQIVIAVNCWPVL